MNKNKFNINEYTSHDDYIDVFDELETIKKVRRFSLSLPKDFDDDDIHLESVEQFIQTPPAPPSSPQLEPVPTQRLTIQVPDDDFYLDLNKNSYVYRTKTIYS